MWLLWARGPQAACEAPWSGSVPAAGIGECGSQVRGHAEDRWRAGTAAGAWDPVTEALMAPWHLCSVKRLSYLGKHPWQQSAVLRVVTVPSRRGFDHGQKQGLRQKVFYGQIPAARAKGVLPGSHAPCAWVYALHLPLLPAVPSGSTEVMYVLRKIGIFAIQFSIWNIFVALKN